VFYFFFFYIFLDNGKKNVKLLPPVHTYAAVWAEFCSGMRAHSFEWTPVPVTRREEVPALLLKMQPRFPVRLRFPVQEACH
ncbi:unnamed protein product, partial [Staurois parvus]